MPTPDESDENLPDASSKAVNQRLVDALQQALSQQDPTIDWSQVNFEGFGPDRFVALEHGDPETDAKLMAALNKLKPDENGDLEETK